MNHLPLVPAKEVSDASLSLESWTRLSFCHNSLQRTLHFLPKQSKSRAAHWRCFARTRDIPDSKRYLRVEWQVTVVDRKSDPFVPSVRTSSQSHDEGDHGTHIAVFEGLEGSAVWNRQGFIVCNQLARHVEVRERANRAVSQS